MALTNYDVFQGDTSVVLNAKPVDSTGSTYDVSVGGWSCKITVSDKAGATEIISRAVTDVTSDKTSFIAYVKPSETTTLTAGNTYLQVIEITNTTIVPIFNLEKHVTLTIKEQGAA